MEIKRVIESNVDIYNISFDEYLSFQFRLLTLREFDLLKKMLNGGALPPFFIYEEIFNICYIGKVNYLSNNIPIGYIISTGEMIFSLSGNSSAEDFLMCIAKEREEQPVHSIYEHMKVVIFSVFSKYGLEDIDKMTEKQFIRTFVSAENVLVNTRPGFERIDLKQIYEELTGKKEKPEETKVEYANDIHSLESQLGHWDLHEAEQRFLKEELDKAKEVALTKAQLAELDKRRS